MIKLSQAIQEQVPDGSTPELMQNYLTQVKLCVEELARKAQDRQMEIRSTEPSTADIEEGGFVAYVSDATIRIYTKQNGSIRYWNLT